MELLGELSHRQSEVEELELKTSRFVVQVQSVCTLSHLFLGEIIIVDNFCVALFSGVPKLTALYNILQHFPSFTNIIHVTYNCDN